jgi:hypothetical protein
MLFKCLLVPLLGLSLLFSRQLSTVEEFYRLYYLPQIFQVEDLRRNLFWLQIALKAPFATEIQALVVPKTPQEYEKYKLLLTLHINYLMAETCIGLAAEYDKHEPLFFNKPYAKDILESLDYARYYYQCSENYWQVVLDLKKQIQTRYRKIHIDLQFPEDILVRIDSGDLDLKRVAERHLAKVEKTKIFFQTP